MTEKQSRYETHGCIVCGNLHQLLVVYNDDGTLYDFKAMGANAKEVKGRKRPLVACAKHSEAEVEAALARVFGASDETED
ncbi:MAG: hypothetical protein LC099_05555 [Anaerolineales bacterium]|nr:hypothetical protein [Anaerolineales bacterium]